MLKYGTGTQAKFDSVNKGLKGSRELERVAASGEFSAGHTFVPSERAAPLCNCAGWVAKAGICSFRVPLICLLSRPLLSQDFKEDFRLLLRITGTPLKLQNRKLFDENAADITR